MLGDGEFRRFSGGNSCACCRDDDNLGATSVRQVQIPSRRPLRFLIFFDHDAQELAFRYQPDLPARPSALDIAQTALFLHQRIRILRAAQEGGIPMLTRTVGRITRGNGSHALHVLALPPSCASSLLSRLDWDALSHSLKLSRRESQIVYLMASDFSEAGIAQQLTISAHTVHSYKERIYRKLRVRSRCAVLVMIFETWVALGAPMHPESE